MIEFCGGGGKEKIYILAIPTIRRREKKKGKRRETELSLIANPAKKRHALVPRCKGKRREIA